MQETNSNNNDKKVPQSSTNDDSTVNAGTANYEIDSDWCDIARLSRKSWTKDNPY